MSEEEVEAPEDRVIYRRHPKEYPHTPLMLLATRTKPPRAKQQLSIGVKTARYER